MVGIVLVSHSEKLAEATAELAKLIAPDARVAPAGGIEDGFGTDYDKIQNAINSVCGEDGAILIMDMGSSVMTAEVILDDLDNPLVLMADCPFVEGAISAAASASMGDGLLQVKAAAEETRTIPKF